MPRTYAGPKATVTLAAFDNVRTTFFSNAAITER